MNILKSILGRIFAVWAMLVFVITMLIIWIPAWLISFIKDEKKRTTRFIALSKIWMAVFIPLSGCRLSVKGKEHFREGENYIVLCNHNSFMDVPVSSPQIPVANKTIAKIEMSRIPIFGIIYRLGSILVDRKSEESRRDSYVQMKRVLNAGMHMCIYPEGTRNKGKEPLQPFQNGAFKLALDTGKPIIPALLFNTGKAMPQKPAFFYWPQHLKMHFLPPVEIMHEDTVDGLREKLFTIMRDYYVANR
jgi:1-acyl-sn-glycerol-3-phosphate acyltransferase